MKTIKLSGRSGWLKYSLRIADLGGGIYAVSCRRMYDLCMLFARYQEYYESPKFRGRKFKLLEFMSWYSGETAKGKEPDVFAYPADWGGFNIPVETIHELVFKIGIEDWNEYDTIMSRVLMAIPDCKYLLGVPLDTKDETLRHEKAHGLFYLDSEYRKTAKRLVRKMNAGVRTALRKYLKKIGYHPKVFDDEIQAYMSTGLFGGMKKIKGIGKERNAFKWLAVKGNNHF